MKYWIKVLLYSILKCLQKMQKVLVLKVLAKLRTELRELRSSCMTIRRLSSTPVFCFISWAATRARSADLHAMYTFAPAWHQPPVSPPALLSAISPPSSSSSTSHHHHWTRNTYIWQQCSAGCLRRSLDCFRVFLRPPHWFLLSVIFCSKPNWLIINVWRYIELRVSSIFCIIKYSPFILSAIRNHT